MANPSRITTFTFKMRLCSQALLGITVCCPGQQEVAAGKVKPNWSQVPFLMLNVMLQVFHCLGYLDICSDITYLKNERPSIHDLLNIFLLNTTSILQALF